MPSLSFSSLVEVRYFVGNSQKAALGEGIYATCHVREDHRLEDLWEDMKFWRMIMGPALGIANPEQIDESELDLPFLEEDKILLRELYYYTREGLSRTANASFEEAATSLPQPAIILPDSEEALQGDLAKDKGEETFPSNTSFQPSPGILRTQISETNLSNDGEEEEPGEDSSFFDDGTPPSPPFTNTGGNGPFKGLKGTSPQQLVDALVGLRSGIYPIKNVLVPRSRISFERGGIGLDRHNLTSLKLLLTLTARWSGKAVSGEGESSPPAHNKQPHETNVESERSISRSSLREETPANPLASLLETLQGFSMSFFEVLSQALALFLGYLLFTTAPGEHFAYGSFSYYKRIRVLFLER